MGKISGKPGPDAGEGGAPRKEIDVKVMRRAAGIGCTDGEIAALLGMHRDTLRAHLSEDPTLQTAIDQAREQGKGTLRRLQWQRANAGSDTMLIWLGKQLLKQTDKQELAIKDVDDTDPKKLSDADLEELAAELRRRAWDHHRGPASQELPDEPAGLVH